MKRFLTNLILIISIISILVIPSFAATTSDSDDIVILKQPVDQFINFRNQNAIDVHFSVVASGNDLTYYWEWSTDLEHWVPFSNNGNASTYLWFKPNESDTFVRCKISSGSNYVYTRIATIELNPGNIFNFVGSCLRYITSYISLIVNSLVTPGASLYPLLPVLCIGIAVAALLIVIKVIKGFSWGM